MNETDYMKRAIELAQLGSGWTSPNPKVGAVIVKDNKIIGEGYHKKSGGLHAEREAFASLKESAEGATLYVTLEPCCHYGKTPPCTEAIVENKIARVVIGSRDPNPLVAGKGVHFLKEHGLEVEEDFLKEECDKLNPIFFHYITTKLPYVALKFAMTLDGKIATRTGASKWITGEASREHVHKLRGNYNAILAGIGTVLADDPMLNSRIEGSHQPIRIIVDSNLKIPLESQIVKTAKDYKTIIAYTNALEEKKRALELKNVELWKIKEKDSHVDLSELIKKAGEAGIDSILIEGGGQIHEAALKEGIVNHIYAYIAPKFFGGSEAKTPIEGEGINLPDEAALLKNTAIHFFDDDILLEYDLKKGMDDVYWNR